MHLARERVFLIVTLLEMVRAKIFVMELPRRINRRFSSFNGQTAFKSEWSIRTRYFPSEIF